MTVEPESKLSGPPSSATAVARPSEKIWKFPPHDVDTVNLLAERCGVSPIVAQLLLKRGITSNAEIRAFLHSKLTDLRPPEELPGLPAAVERIMRAVHEAEEIVVYGDYDADGMTSTAILYRCLKLLGAKVSYHLPNRMEEGYGLHVDSIEKLAARGKQLVITVDCGIASLEPARRAKELGLSLVITDHHRYGDELPIADAIVHPALPGTNYPFTGLCGAGVAFKLAWALCQSHTGSPRVSEHLRDFLLQAVGLAAIGTVADVVPLLDENRIIVRNGLKTIHNSPSVGLRKLMQVTKIDQKSELGSEDIGFTLAPRLNAAGRLGQAQLGVELLITEDEARAEALANYIEELNENRNKLQRSIQLAASKQLKEIHSPEDDPAFVLAAPNWHPGIIGIVAGRLAEKYNKPVVIIALDNLGVKPAMGSARSPNGVNLHEALQQCQELLISGGGHAAAAGLKIEEANVAAFRSAFLEAVSEQGEAAGARPELSFDAEATFSHLDLATVSQIEQMGPFGMGNPRPVFCALGVALVEPPKPLGTTGRHLSVQLVQYDKKMRAVSFGTADEWLAELEQVQAPIDLAFRPVINEFRGFRKVEIHMVDWRGQGANQ
ncbi:single-stranded-DNA-specific exonuclease RecJ [Aureliella helgolandensis]|uniref:Single-stranded-DNA-specific exonuclease RecJ n=1 Tax=Aureliella helgolandensis TaxID=2527968 RepID=A0A518G0M6_9BACT|nr:single-stranded-DNA-specific exonuclease RecJ [Aureliella helgolandensis]QDV22126.1 Single-stranded-DNA-specific exonuclease RecJ [Aureliella helgolandensis]